MGFVRVLLPGPAAGARPSAPLPRCRARAARPPGGVPSGVRRSRSSSSAGISTKRRLSSCSCGSVMRSWRSSARRAAGRRCRSCEDRGAGRRGAAELALEPLHRVEQLERLERRRDARAGVQEARLVGQLADGVGVVGRGAREHAHARARQGIHGRLQVGAALADVRAETEQPEALGGALIAARTITCEDCADAPASHGYHPRRRATSLAREPSTRRSAGARVRAPRGRRLLPGRGHGARVVGSREARRGQLRAGRRRLGRRHARAERRLSGRGRRGLRAGARGRREIGARPRPCRGGSARASSTRTASPGRSRTTRTGRSHPGAA